MAGQECSQKLPIWGIGSFIGTQMAIRAAIELNVFNIISDSGPEAQLSSAEIVSKIPTTNTEAAAIALERILRMLSINSILSSSPRPPCANGETRQERTYGLTMVSRSLVTNSDGDSLAPLALRVCEKEVLASLYRVKDAVLEPGCSPFYKAHGLNFFEYLAEHPGLSGKFNEEMAGLSKMLLDTVLKVYSGFEEVKQLMDVGGGNGTSLGKIVSFFPHIHGINFDLPHVIADAVIYPGVVHVAGDMFESLPNAQTILMKFVLHDWDDNHCLMLLRNCWKALPESGKVIVVEFAIPHAVGNNAESLNAVTLDFVMMAVIIGAKERTIAEFDDLAKKTGFAETKVFPVEQGLHVMEFIKSSIV